MRNLIFSFFKCLEIVVSFMTMTRLCQFSSGRRSSKAQTKPLKYLPDPIKTEFKCQTTPRNVSHNTCFVINVSSLKSKNDWKSDDMGAWENKGVQRFYYVLNERGEFVRINRDDIVESGQKFTLTRTYFNNSSSVDLCKYASYIEGN